MLSSSYDIPGVIIEAYARNRNVVTMSTISNLPPNIILAQKRKV